MKKIISMMLAIIMLIIPVIPEISYAATGHINGCPNTGYDTSCCTKTYSIRAKEGYRVVDVIVNGVNMGPITSYTFTNIIGPQTLKVITEKISSFIITYDANGGGGIPESQEKKSGVDLILSDTIPTREGYTFTGWNTASDGSGTNYDAGGTYVSEKEATLYAQWTINKYTIRYDANGGENPPSSQEKIHGTDLTISSTKPTRTGYTFSKWNTKSDGTGTNYSSGGTYTEEAGTTLYAVWTINKYTIRYDANGGENPPSSQEKIHGTNLTLTSAKPTRTGYTFLKWNTVSDGSGISYNAGATYITETGVTLYAIWESDLAKLPTFTYTGQYQIVNDGVSNGVQNWRIKFLSSGTLNITNLGSGMNGIDSFIVGGGGSSTNYFVGGGGGYTKTVKNMVLSTGTNYSVVVGGSDVASSFNGTTANPGSKGYAATSDTGAGAKYMGGDGGSGGANASAYKGGTNGGNGGGADSGSSGSRYGRGQGTTTKEFGESTGALYSTGGNGGDHNNNSSRLDNSGDGGCGTGSGKSGIVIIRNSR